MFFFYMELIFFTEEPKNHNMELIFFTEEPKNHNY